jgi:hypothetical protein
MIILLFANLTTKGQRQKSHRRINTLCQKTCKIHVRKGRPPELVLQVIGNSAIKNGLAAKPLFPDGMAEFRKHLEEIVPMLEDLEKKVPA